MEKLQQTCCFFGHRTINYTDDLITKLTESIDKLITEKKVDTFLFAVNRSLIPYALGS